MVAQRCVRSAIICMLALALSACRLPKSGSNLGEATAIGKALYEQHCASCHGLEGEGQPDWKVPGPNGVYPAPPHTADGHTWHHADQLLLQIMANGGSRPNSSMPGFREQLTATEMAAILAYIKTFWGEQELEFQQQMTEQHIEGDND